MAVSSKTENYQHIRTLIKKYGGEGTGEIYLCPMPEVFNEQAADAMDEAAARPAEHSPLAKQECEALNKNQYLSGPLSNFKRP